MRKLELFLKRIIYGEQKGIFAFLIKMLLLPLSWIYGWVVCLRNHFYENGWMRRYTPPIPLVISIGNIVAGGTGKTPLTLFVAQSFYDRFQIAILSRGYRSQIENKLVVICDGCGPKFPASYCGDEPFLLSKHLPKALVIVGSDRKQASFMAAKAGVHMIILDDAMQHRRLARDFDIVVIDSGDPFGKGYFLPRGFLRDDVKSLSRAHLIVLNHIENKDQYENIKKQLLKYSKAPVVGMNTKVKYFKDLKGHVVVPQAGDTVAMFCTIAHPEYFKKTLENEHLIVDNEYILPDHDVIDVKSLEHFAKKCLKNKNKWLICTEKDCVKLEDSLQLSLPILWVQMELSVTFGQEIWNNFLKVAESKIA